MYTDAYDDPHASILTNYLFHHGPDVRALHKYMGLSLSFDHTLVCLLFSRSHDCRVQNALTNENCWACRERKTLTANQRAQQIMEVSFQDVRCVCTTSLHRACALLHDSDAARCDLSTCFLCQSWGLSREWLWGAQSRLWQLPENWRFVWLHGCCRVPIGCVYSIYLLSTSDFRDWIRDQSHWDVGQARDVSDPV